MVCSKPASDLVDANAAATVMSNVVPKISTDMPHMIPARSSRIPGGIAQAIALKTSTPPSITALAIAYMRGPPVVWTTVLGVFGFDAEELDMNKSLWIPAGAGRHRVR